MANEQELFGMPQIIINFRTKGTTAIKRSARGIVSMILHNETKDEIHNYTIRDVSDIPDTGLTDENVDLIKKCLLGTPLRILVYTLPNTNVEGATKDQDDVLKMLANIKWNWLCAPTATTQEQNDLASWIKAQRSNKHKTFKAVLSGQAADHEGIVNFCTNDIKVKTDTDSFGNPVYTTYTAVQYTARIAGILAGLALDRSATYFKLTEVESVEVYEDIDTLIDKGELLLIDEQDGDGVKIARACNSLTTFTTDKGEEFRKIKIIEGVDLVTDDIRDTFKKYYVGKIINGYNNKMLFISAIMVYFSGIEGNVLDADATNTVDINTTWQSNYAKLHGDDPTTMSVMEIRQYNTGDTLALVGDLRFVDAMENLNIDFTL
ncbi:phage tail sheath subtilisin-like domain-containing protein [Megasphaera elsdenii]|uniref:phage tail sheath subtilisin-like domain-containing protein n=1 Tax=Megasphaera elsdenii TaxID=907 RepID=UPI000912AC19|nr:phage tail sheath subtilisin-like domain-containing protein [Megasphaera elsdenii]SHK01507.1 Phage tail sheath protein [Megasphaera elsdenii]